MSSPYWVNELNGDVVSRDSRPTDSGAWVQCNSSGAAYDLSRQIKDRKNAERKQKELLEKQEKLLNEQEKAAKLQQEKEELSNQGVSSYSELVDKSLNTNQKSIIIAMFLNLFLGFLGAHWFYLGDKKRGKLYLKSLGLFFFGWLIDFVRLPMLGIKNNQYKKKGVIIGTIIWVVVFILVMIAAIGSKGQSVNDSNTKTDNSVETKVK